MSKYVPYKDVGRLALQHISISNGEWAYAMEGLPTIDIVFCEECKYCVNGTCWKRDGLDKLDGYVADDDFCSRGERKSDE